jgi:hypothetical protein
LRRAEQRKAARDKLTPETHLKAAHVIGDMVILKLFTKSAFSVRNLLLSWVK